MISKRAKGGKAVGGQLDPRFGEQHRHVHKNLDGPLFKQYAEQFLGEGALDRHSK